MTVGVWPVWAVVPVGFAALALAYVAAVLDAVFDPTGPRRGRWIRPVAEGSRLLRQSRRATPAPDLLLWRVGTAGPLVVALLMAVVVPFGGHVVAGMDVGIVWFNAMDVLLWAFWWLAGWGPNSAHSLVGGYRYLAQALAYELPLMFALTTPAIAASSLDVREVVGAQDGGWFVLQMPVALVVFGTCVVAFSVWGPFAYPAGADVAGGLLLEPTAVDRLLVLVGRYALLGVGAAMSVALFLGGSAGPVAAGWWWSLLKTLAVLAVLVAVRRRVPTIRADKLMAPAWGAVLPLTLLQVLVVSIIAIG